jgi:hypothetical protein
MSTFLKIHQGTGKLTGQSLCRSCENGVIRKGVRGEEDIQCDVFGKPIVQNITDCSSYYNKALPSLRSFEQLAWTLLTDKKNKVGFKPPNKNEDW